MGRASRWLKSILGLKKQNDKEKMTKSMKNEDVKREKKGKIEGRWSFTKASKDNIKEKEKDWYRNHICDSEKEQTKHAIALAAATATAADAAVAAAQAAVAVVRLTSHGRGTLFSNGGKYVWAAVRIQTHFRGYLARRALRALKGLVKLQALVRGYLVRKRAAATLQSMQALIRAQKTARSQRVNQVLGRSNKFQSDFRARKSMEKFDEARNDQFHSKRLSTSYEPYNNNPFEGSPKIVEIDTYYNKPKSRSRRINPSLYDFGSEDMLQCPYPSRVSLPDYQNTHRDYDWSFPGDECQISTSQCTPRFTNSTRSNAPLTPTKSVCGDSFFRPYSNFPSYMADTQSFRAKQRSQSAPKQRPESRPKSRLSLDDIMGARNSISGVRMQRSSSIVQDYPLNLL